MSRTRMNVQRGALFVHNKILTVEDQVKAMNSFHLKMKKRAKERANDALRPRFVRWLGTPGATVEVASAELHIPWYSLRNFTSDYNLSLPYLARLEEFLTSRGLP